MKDLITWLSAITLLQGAIAVPHGKHARCCVSVSRQILTEALGAGSKFHPIKRDADVEYVTIPSEIVVWVNQHGSTLRVETNGCVVTKPVEVSYYKVGLAL